MKLSKSVINGGLFSIYSFVNRGINFVLLIVIAKFIPPGDYGQLSLFTTVVTFLSYFIALSTIGYESISYFKKSRNEYTSDFTAIHLIATVMLAFFAIVLFFFGDRLGVSLSLSKLLLWLALILSFLDVFPQMFLGYYRVTQKLRNYGFVSVGNAILNFVLTLLFVITFAQGWMGRIYSHLVCSLVITIIAIIAYFKYDLISFSNQSKERFKDIIIWGVPLIPHMAAIWIRQGLDRYIINDTHTLDDVGLFSFALNITGVIIMVGSSFNNSFSVEIYQTLSSDKDNSQKKKSLLSKTKKMALLFIGATVLIVIGCSVAIPFLLPTYKGALPYFYVLALYGLIQCFYFLVVNYLFYYKKNKWIMYTTLGTSLLHLGLSLLLTRYSLYFTCFIYVFIQTLIVGLIFTFSRKVLKKELAN